jgi:hypothetical protein
MAGTSFYFQLLLAIALLSTLNRCSQATNAFQSAQQLRTSVIVEAAAAVTQHKQGGALESTPPLHLDKQHWQTTQQQYKASKTAEATAASHAAAVQRVLLQEARTSIQLRPIPEDPVPQAASKGQQQHTAPSGTASNTASWKAQQQQQQQLQQQQAQPAQPVISKGFLNHDSHKSLLPIDYKDVILFILSFLVLSLAAGAGIGKWQGGETGGGVFGGGGPGEGFVCLGGGVQLSEGAGLDALCAPRGRKGQALVGGSKMCVWGEGAGGIGEVLGGGASREVGGGGLTCQNIGKGRSGGRRCKRMICRAHMHGGKQI